MAAKTVKKLEEEKKEKMLSMVLHTLSQLLIIQ